MIYKQNNNVWDYCSESSQSHASEYLDQAHESVNMRLDVRSECCAFLNLTNQKAQNLINVGNLLGVEVVNETLVNGSKFIYKPRLLQHEVG